MVGRDLRRIDREIKRDLKEIGREVERDFRKLLQQEIREEKRVPIPSKTKEAVYERAKGRCERCGIPLKKTDTGAHFHHLRKPTAKSRPPTIQFLCATCHFNHGHNKSGRKIVRKKVRKNPSSPHWKMKPKSTRKKTKRKTTSKKKSTTKKAKKGHAKRKRPKTPLERLTKQLEKDFF